MEEFNSVYTLKAVLLDNTNTNTDWEGDLVTALENKTEWKWHIIGHSLHQNELPFRVVFKHLDGISKSPTTFTGSLGNLCENDCQDLPQVEFTKLSGSLNDVEFAEETVSDLSSDQRLFLE